MKTRQLPVRRRGFALLLVLIVVTFAAAIAVMFLLSARQERSSTASYAQGSRVRELASQTVNLVMGQINAATKEGQSTTSGQISWASQPGMIRTYNTQGSLSNVYKLYSWNNLVEAGAGFNPNAATELPPTTWVTSPALYTDLNAPVNSGTNAVYPIADPTIANTTSGGVTTVKSGTPSWDFPGVFSIVTDNAGYTASTTNTLPMPVQWLYVLQDGTWVTPTGGVSTNTVTVTGATTANPIVGRIAFWTDDETSKVNVNTAAEGSYWDVPKSSTNDEMQFAGNPPLQNEFQRLSGHPATTSFSAVFPELYPVVSGTKSISRWNGTGVNTTLTTALKDLFGYASTSGLTPRISWGSSLTAGSSGGSDGGTYPISSYNQSYAPPNTTPTNNSGITLHSDRLYATPDELWFQPTRSVNTVFGDSTFWSSFKAQDLSKRLFFLTANSRAPETTLYETPRISLWPITWPYDSTSVYIPANYTNSNGTTFHSRTPVPTTLSPTSTAAALTANPWVTPQERLLAFCSTLNQGATTTLPYYFQRQNPDSPTWDFNGPSGSVKIQRNIDMVKYLRTEMTWTPPGMGGTGATLEAKWGSDNADWISLNCFDFTRSQMNQYTYNSDSSSTAGMAASSDYLYAFTGMQLGTGSKLNSGTTAHYEPNAYTVTPLRATMPTSLKTYTTEGAYPSLKEAAIVFYASNRLPPVPPVSGLFTDYVDPNKWSQLITNNASQTTEMKMVMVLSFAQMNPGVMAYRGNSIYSPCFWVKVSGSNQFSVTPNGGSAQLIGFPLTSGSSGSAVQFNTFRAFGNSFYNPLIAQFMYGLSGNIKTFINGTTAYNNWGLVSGIINVPASATTFTFTGQPIQVDIYACNPDQTTDPTGNSDLLVASQKMDFSQWNGTYHVPLAPRWNVHQPPMVQSGSSATGVLMPTVTTTGTWTTELVPDISAPSNQTLSLGTITDPRATATSYNINTTQWDITPICYAYTDQNSSTGSRDFAYRVKYCLGSTTLLSETGVGGVIATQQPLFATSYGASLGQGQSIVQLSQLITPYDVVLSMVPDPSTNAHGDPRLIGRGEYTTTVNPATTLVGSTKFITSQAAALKAYPGVTPAKVIANNNNGPSLRSTMQEQYHELTMSNMDFVPTGYHFDYTFGTAPDSSYSTAPGSATSTRTMAMRGGYTTSGSTLLSRNSGDAYVGNEAGFGSIIDTKADWTSMPGSTVDGGYIFRPDQEYQVLYSNSGQNGMVVPYFKDSADTSGSSISLHVFSPNRQVPSPVVLGTLPSDMNTGWQTLTFCPNPARQIISSDHPGVGTPLQSNNSATGAAYTKLPDHLLLDLFWMPVSEPYPISQQYSTAGKVNLNYAMMPFPYIQRKNALDAVLKSVCITAMPSPFTSTASANFAKYYKAYGILATVSSNLTLSHTRFPVNVYETLRAFDAKFASGDIFRSGSQICDMFLYPNDPSTANTLWAGSDGYYSNGISTEGSAGSTTNIKNWWLNSEGFTSDNQREDPYNAIYSRITTKSNTYTVHWKVQALHKVTVNGTDAAPTVWTEGKDQVVSELRGSSLIERYLDPNATNIPDYATVSNPQPLTYFYKWRIDSENYFQPPP